VQEVEQLAEQLPQMSQEADASSPLGRRAGPDVRAACMAGKVDPRAQQRVRAARELRNMLQLRRTCRSTGRVQGTALRVCGAARRSALG
jgi:hypothetical protein